MAIVVEFYTFSKKRNSTAFPSTGATTFNMELKEPTSALNPTLWVAARDLPVPGAAPTIYNYAHVAAFQRYYFVSDWVYNAGVWEVSLTVDPLGSWKTGIGSITCFVERSSYSFDSNIVDNLYPGKNQYQIVNIADFVNPWQNVSQTGGSYILGVITKDASVAVGATTYYICTQAQLRNFLDFLFNGSIYNASNITEMGQGLYQSFFNPFQYVVSCMWLPIDPNGFLNSVTANIKCGYWDTGVSAKLLADGGREVRYGGTIPAHPQASRGVYLNYSPFTKVTLYIPPFGRIPVDTSGLCEGNYLWCPMWVDHITGEATLRITITDVNNKQTTKVLTEMSAQIGVPVQLAQIASEYSRSSPTSFLTNVVSEGIAALLGSTVGSSFNAGCPVVYTSGANGSFINYMLAPLGVVEYTLLTNEDNTNFGRPLMQSKQINTIPGFIKAVDPPISLPITETETQMIRQYMTDGFYYE